MLGVIGGAHTQGGEVLNFAERFEHRIHRYNRFAQIIFFGEVCASLRIRKEVKFSTSPKYKHTDYTDKN